MQIRKLGFFTVLLLTLSLAACGPAESVQPPLPTNTPVPTFTPTPEVVVAPVDPAVAATAQAQAAQATTDAAQGSQVVTQPPAEQPATEQPAAEQPAPPAEPTATETPAPPADPAVVTNQGMNVRSGPGTNYGVIGSATAGQRFIVTGKNPQGDWWQVNFNGQNGWVFGPLVSAQNTGGVQVAANIPAPPPPPATPVPPPPTATPVPAQPTQPPAPTAPPAPDFPFLLLEGVEQCAVNQATTYFEGFVRARDNSLLNGVCVHIAFFGPRNTKCSGCDGVGDGNWGFSPFGGPAPAGTTVEIYVVPCSGPMPLGGNTVDTGFGDLTPQSPKWVRTIGESTQCQGITFVRK